MPWKRIAKIAAGVLGFVVVLIGAAAAGGYYFLTSADFRSRVESEASAYSGRKTKIEKISIDWGAISHVHLAGVNIANADWGKSPHMFKADEIDFDIRLWPLLKGDIVLPLGAQPRRRCRQEPRGAASGTPQRAASCSSG